MPATTCSSPTSGATEPRSAPGGLWDTGKSATCAALSEGIGVEDCDAEADWKNHGQFVSCVAKAANERVAALNGCDDQAEEIHGCIVSQAARSDTGKQR